MTGRPSCCLSL